VTVDMRFCEPCKGDDFNLVAGGICQPCPMGAKCTAGDRLEALPDWWCVRRHGVHQPCAHAHAVSAGALRTHLPSCSRAPCTQLASRGLTLETVLALSGAYKRVQSFICSP